MSYRKCSPCGAGGLGLLVVLTWLVKPLCAAAETSFTVGVKAWATTWSTWALDQKPYNSASYQTVASLESDTAIAVIPLVSVRSGKWFVSGSYMTKTKYELTAAEPAGPLQHAIGVRSEVDANIGYSIVPGLAITAGYKELKQQFGSTFKWSGPTVGLALSAPLGSSGLGVYGTIGYGFLTLDLPSGTTDASGHSSRPANYELSEVGIVYAFNPSWWPRSRITATLGYRAQTVTTRDYGLSSSPLDNPAALSEYTQTDVRDHTQGFTLTLLATL